MKQEILFSRDKATSILEAYILQRKSMQYLLDFLLIIYIIIKNLLNVKLLHYS